MTEIKTKTITRLRQTSLISNYIFSNDEVETLPSHPKKYFYKLFNQCFFYRIKINSKAITNLDLFVKKTNLQKAGNKLR